MERDGKAAGKDMEKCVGSGWQLMVENERKEVYKLGPCCISVMAEPTKVRALTSFIIFLSQLLMSFLTRCINLAQRSPFTLLGIYPIDSTIFIVLIVPKAPSELPQNVPEALSTTMAVLQVNA